MATEKQKSTSKKENDAKEKGAKGKVSKGAQEHGDIPQETQKEKEQAARKGR